MHRLLKALQLYGHSVRVCALGKERYEYDGVEVHPHSGMQTMFHENNEICQWADVVFTQLIGSAVGFNKAKQHSKPLIFFAHNTSKHYAINGAKVVYNSQYLASLNLFTNQSTVMQPIFKIGKQSTGRKIAIVNCNQFKGGHRFVELAKLLPKYDFVGILGGYGDQVTVQLPNLQYRPNSPEMDWSEIGILLVLSEIESWSMVASEAICHGIPVICNDLPSLRENLSYAGIYMGLTDLSEWVRVIEYLMWDKSKQVKICQQRATELTDNNRIEAFNNWLVNIVE